jgi:hypothetical protein
MSGAEWRAYHRSPGVVYTRAPDAGDLETRVQEILDQRDKEHDDIYKHKPGAVEECTLPGREVYEDTLRGQLAERRSIFPFGCTTREAQDLIRLQNPRAFIYDPALDAETNRARREMAARIDALEVTRG